MKAVKVVSRACCHLLQATLDAAAKFLPHAEHAVDLDKGGEHSVKAWLHNTGKPIVIILSIFLLLAMHISGHS